MTRKEFLQILYDSLAGEIPEREIQNNLNYYEDYIKTQAANRSEEDVRAQLGNPQMIAKSIIEAFKASGQPFIRNNYHNTSSKEQYSAYEEEKPKNKSAYHINLPGWVGTIVSILIVCIILYVFFWIGGVAFCLIIRFGVPLLCIYLLYRVIKNLRS